MGQKGTAILDFGAGGAFDASVVVTGQTGISDGGSSAISFVSAWVAYDTSADHLPDEHLAESIRVVAGTIVQNTGFTIYGMCDVGPTFGKWIVSWVWV